METPAFGTNDQKVVQESNNLPTTDVSRIVFELETTLGSIESTVAKTKSMISALKSCLENPDG